MRDKPNNCLLIGNGINMPFDGKSWEDFLIDIATDKMKDKLLTAARSIFKDNEERTLKNAISKINCPFPLLAVLLTEDNINNSLRSVAYRWLSGSNDGNSPWNVTISEAQHDFITKILSLNIENIFTTNYTYELEMADIYPSQFTREKRREMQGHTSLVPKAEIKYLLHTYLKLENHGKKIWHIHGEIDKPNSMILGHYYYAKSIHKMESELESHKITPNNRDKDNESWLKLFLLSNIYCIGFSMDLSELDMWWLLNRKANEKENVGKIYFYEPRSDTFDAKAELMRVIKNRSTGESLFEVIDLGYKKPNVDWDAFYCDAVKDINSRINNSVQSFNEERELLMV